MHESAARILPVEPVEPFAPVTPDRPASDRAATVLQLRRAVAQAGVESSPHVGAPLPVAPGLEQLLPDGALRRGTVVEVAGSPALAIALAAASIQAGAWAACVGLPTLGWSAASVAGWNLSRVVAVTPSVRRWSGVMAALVDAMDLLLIGPDPAPSAAEARRLHARARERGAVLLLVGGARSGWEDRADVRLRAVSTAWSGVGQGWGHLESVRMVVECSGRRAASRSRRIEVDLP